MQPIRSALRKSFFLAAILSFLFVGGIPAIVLGAVNGIGAVMGIGIGATVVGFYGAPVAWVGYAEKRSLYRLVSAVVEEHIYTVQELSAQLSLPEKNVSGKLTTCFQKQYLMGFKRVGDELKLNENTALSETVHAAVCPNCGAKYSYQERIPNVPTAERLFPKNKQNRRTVPCGGLLLCYFFSFTAIQISQ